jgi:hypothetical protein
MRIANFTQSNCTKILEANLVEGTYQLADHLELTTFLSAGRRVYRPKSQIDARIERAVAKNLQSEFHRAAHPHVFAYLCGRGPIDLLLEMQLSRLKGHSVIKLDIIRSFPSSDLSRIKKLTRHQVDLIFDRKFTIAGEVVRLAGLVTGLATSAICHALLMSPVAKRLNRAYRSFFYGDDIYVIIP